MWARLHFKSYDYILNLINNYRYSFDKGIKIIEYELKNEENSYLKYIALNILKKFT